MFCPARTLALALVAGGALLAAQVPAQIVNGSFENGTLPPWTGTGVIVSSLPDATFPRDGTRYLTILGITGAPSTPHSNEGGPGVDATNTAGAQLEFSIGNPSDTTLEFDAIFMKGDPVNVDFMEASISDGTTVWNILHIDTTDTGVGPPSITTLPTSLVHPVAVDLAALFPTATGSTTFTLRLHVGNANTISAFSRGYVDDVRLTPGLGVESDEVKFVPVGASHLIDVHTVGPNRRFYHLISGNVTGPVGEGPLVGLWFDPLVFSILELPLGTHGFHFVTDANGDYQFSLPTAVLPTGLVLDHMIAVLHQDAVESLSSVERYVWP